MLVLTPPYLISLGRSKPNMAVVSAVRPVLGLVMHPLKEFCTLSVGRQWPSRSIENSASSWSGLADPKSAPWQISWVDLHNVDRIRTCARSSNTEYLKQRWGKFLSTLPLLAIDHLFALVPSSIVANYMTRFKCKHACRTRVEQLMGSTSWGQVLSTTPCQCIPPTLCQKALRVPVFHDGSGDLIK